MVLVRFQRLLIMEETMDKKREFIYYRNGIIYNVSNKRYGFFVEMKEMRLICNNRLFGTYWWCSRVTKRFRTFGIISGDEKICSSSASKNRSSCTIFWNILYFVEMIINVIIIKTGGVVTYKTGSIPVPP